MSKPRHRDNKRQARAERLAQRARRARRHGSRETPRGALDLGVVAHVLEALGSFTDDFGLTPMESEVLQRRIEGVAMRELPAVLAVTPAQLEDLSASICNKSGSKSIDQAAGDVLRVVVFGVRSGSLDNPAVAAFLGATEGAIPDAELPEDATEPADYDAIVRSICEKSGVESIHTLVLDILRESVLGIRCR